MDVRAARSRIDHVGGPRVEAAGTGITYLTFARTVAIPGTTLAPGTYIFEKVDTTSRSDLVRVMSRDRSHVFLTQFDEGGDRPSGSPRRHARRPRRVGSGATPKMEAWVPAGDEFTYHFVYGSRERSEAALSRAAGR